MRRWILFFIMITEWSVLSTGAAFAQVPLQARFASDLEAFRIARAGLQRAAEHARAHPELFTTAKHEPLALLPRDKKLAIWNTWSSIMAAQAALDDIRGRWSDAVFTGRHTERNTAFSLTHAAFLASYRYGLELVSLADGNPELDTILNEAVPELGIPERTFDRYKFRFLNASLATEFSALRAVDRGLVRTRKELKPVISEDSAYIWRMGKGRGYVLSAKQAADALRKTGFAAWFPVQKNLSEWMGDTKVRRKGTHLISGAQIEALRPRLQPGDIFFERHEWYLSNLGLPGFWTHVALYVGTPAEREACFSDPDVQTWVRSQGADDGRLETLLKLRYPQAYTRSRTPQEEGHPARILEAISEGVAFTSLERTGASDSLAVVRPRLGKIEKAQAILRAFHFNGRPYDFNFDFETDAALVCSEVVFKSYAAGQGMQGLRFPLSEVMGRKVSTPNDMVRQFDEQAGASAQADFIAFLDGFEKEKRAVESTEAAFRNSWTRPNWHILVQAPPVDLAKASADGQP